MANRPTFYELVILGPQNLAHGLLTGLILGSGHGAICFDGPTEDIEGATLKERTKSILHIRPHENQFIVDNVTRSLLKKHLKLIESETGLELISDRRVLKARFGFEYTAFAGTYDLQIKKLLDGLPQGVKLVNHEREETVTEEAKGPEGYAPLHDFEVRATGDIQGRIDQVIEARHTLLSHPLVATTEIQLELAGS